ncbi:MAG: TetR/AcrR family transcriptional regulator [Rhodothermales bacterium]
MSREAREAAIYQAAARVFRAKGYHAARIQDVAEELGMHKGSLYYYISSKEDLLRGLVEGPLQRVVEATRGVLATRHAAAQKLALIIELHLRHFQEHSDFFGIFLHEDLDFLNQNAESDIRALVKEYDALWDALLEEGKKRGEFHADLEVAVVRKAIIYMCNGVFVWFKPHGAYPLQEIARLFAEFALNGVLAPEARHKAYTGEN